LYEIAVRLNRKDRKNLPIFSVNLRLEKADFPMMLSFAFYLLSKKIFHLLSDKFLKNFV
jgi:hypothetical protein